jgi:hypothetical protein
MEPSVRRTEARKLTVCVKGSHSGGRITPSTMVSRGAPGWRRIRRRWQSVRCAGHSRAGVATRGVAGVRRCVRGAHWIRALQVALLTTATGISHGRGGRDRRLSACSRGDDSFPVDHLNDSAYLVPRAFSVARDHCCSGVSGGATGCVDTSAPAARQL